MSDRKKFAFKPLKSAPKDICSTNLQSLSTALTTRPSYPVFSREEKYREPTAFEIDRKGDLEFKNFGKLDERKVPQYLRTSSKVLGEDDHLCLPFFNDNKHEITFPIHRSDFFLNCVSETATKFIPKLKESHPKDIMWLDDLQDMHELTTSDPLIETLNVELSRDPQNIELWIRFAECNSDESRLSTNRSNLERKLAILSLGILKNPYSFDLRLKYLNCANLIFENSKMEQLWTESLVTFSGDASFPQLVLQYVKWALHESFSTAKFDRIEIIFKKYIESCKSHLVEEFICFLVNTGYSERALVYINVLISLCRSLGSNATSISSFDDRVISYEENYDGSCGFSGSKKDQENFEEDLWKTQFSRFVAMENARDNTLMVPMPLFGYFDEEHDSEDDGNRCVLWENIEPFLVPINNIPDILKRSVKEFLAMSMADEVIIHTESNTEQQCILNFVDVNWLKIEKVKFSQSNSTFDLFPWQCHLIIRDKIDKSRASTLLQFLKSFDDFLDSELVRILLELTYRIHGRELVEISAKQLLAKYPSRIDYYKGYAKMLWALEDYSQAEKIFQIIRTSCTDVEWDEVTVSLIKLSLHQYKDAKVYLDDFRNFSLALFIQKLRKERNFAFHFLTVYIFQGWEALSFQEIFESITIEGYETLIQIGLHQKHSQEWSETHEKDLLHICTKAVNVYPTHKAFWTILGLIDHSPWHARKLSLKHPNFSWILESALYCRSFIHSDGVDKKSCLWRLASSVARAKLSDPYDLEIHLKHMELMIFLQEFETVKQLVYESIQRFPLHKKLYMYIFSISSRLQDRILSYSEMLEVLNVMEEKGVRVRTLIEEVA